MKKVAVFGNAAGGKSTLAKRLSELTRLPLYPLDTIQYKRGGGKVAETGYLRAHAELLARDQWIIDGFGCVPSAWERFAAADTLIYIDLPLMTHYRWVTKRFFQGLFVNPEGWPEGSPIWSSSLDSYSEGRETVQIGMNATLFRIAAIAGPIVFLGVAYYALGGQPMGMPWFLVAAPVIFAAIAYATVTWMCGRSRVRVTMDRKAGKLLVGTSEGKSEVRIADVEKAEFGMEKTEPGPELGDQGSTLYRLEFVMKSGERVPATSMYTNMYARGDQARMVAAINAALVPRMV